MLMNSNALLKELVPVTPRGEATRKKLLAAAEIEFGSRGFPAASVSAITQRADVGQGTFYLYFHSKEAVFATLVRDIGAEQCSRIQQLAAEASAKDGERQLLATLLAFVAQQPGRHRILSESQFVDAPVFREARENLFAVVAATLAASGNSGRAADLSLRAAALVGAAEQAALQQCLWGGKPVGRTLVEALLSS